MSGIIFMLLLVLLPSLLVTPLLGAKNVSSITIVRLIRRLWGLSLFCLLLILIFSDNDGLDWYFGLAIIWVLIAAVSYWIINKLTILIIDKRDALYGIQLDIKWWEFKKWKALREHVNTSRKMLATAKDIMQAESNNDEKAEILDAMFPVDYYTKVAHAGWVGIIPAVNICENLYEVGVMYKDISKDDKAEEWFSMISTHMHEVITRLMPRETQFVNMEDTLTRMVNLWIKASIQWIQLVTHPWCCDESATLAWSLLKGLYDIQKKLSYMVPVYKHALQYIHKEMVYAFVGYNNSVIKDNPMQIVYVSALDKLQELDINNKDLSKYRHEACTANLLDLIREDIILARKK